METNIQTGATVVKNNFDIQEAFVFGWETFKKHWKVLTLIMLIGFAVGAAIGGIQTAIEWPYTVIDPETGVFTYGEIPLNVTILSAIFSLISAILSVWFSYNSVKIYLNIVDGVNVKVSDLFAKVDKTFWLWLWTSICLGLAIIGGLILFIIPGIYIALRYGYAPNLIIDKKAHSVKEAFNMSSKMTEGVKWKLIWMGILCMLLVLVSLIVGLICLIVGIIPAVLISTMVLTFASLFVYRKLYSQVTA